MSHDRHLLDRVSTEVLALDGLGGAQRYVAYDQWEADRTPQAPSRRNTPRAPTEKAQRSVARRLTYLEQREWDGMEAAVLETEARLEVARGRTLDPSIATDAGMLQKRLSELGELQSQVDRLYARWAELEGKRK